METVFVTHSFRDPDRELLVNVQIMIESHALRMVTGRSVVGGDVSDEVQRLIRRADAVVALAMPDPTSGNRATYSWVAGEYVMARDLKKPTVALVHQDVTLAGPYSDRERIPYEPKNAAPAFVRLCEVIGEWQRRDGRRVRLRVGPEDVAQRLAREAGRAKCQWRYYDERGNFGDWAGASVVPEQGGPVVYLEHVPEGALIELCIELRGGRWVSQAVSSVLVFAELRQEEDDK